MPIHDWTRVGLGTFHAFHVSWVSEIQESLNAGLLPPDYYAQAEQIAGPLGPDVLTLQTNDFPESEMVEGGSAGFGGLAVATAPPRARLTASAEMDDYTLKRRTIVIRHSSGDRIVALLEIVSPGNKSSRHALRSFVEKAAESIYRGWHLLVVDLFPPSPRDPQGIHAAIWREITECKFELPSGEPLTLAAYSVGPSKVAYIEPTAVGRELIEMPLFRQPEIYVKVRLEATYRAAYRGVAQRWKKVLE